MRKPRPPLALNGFIAALPREEQRKIAARARTLIAEEMSLRELRRALGRTQVAVALRMGVGQDAVSKLEMRGDMHVSTLRDMVHALGGELELVARFPGRSPTKLRTPGDRRHQPRERTSASK